MKVGDLIQSSAFEGHHGIVIEADHESDPDGGSWYHVVWFKLSWDRYEWCRAYEIEPRDIS